MPMHKLRRGCAAGKMLDGKALGGRCAGQKSWRGTHVVLCYTMTLRLIPTKINSDENSPSQVKVGILPFSDEDVTPMVAIRLGI